MTPHTETHWEDFEILQQWKLGAGAGVGEDGPVLLWILCCYNVISTLNFLRLRDIQITFTCLCKIRPSPQDWYSPLLNKIYQNELKRMMAKTHSWDWSSNCGWKNGSLVVTFILHRLNLSKTQTQQRPKRIGHWLL